MFFRLAFGSMVDLSKIKEMSPKLLCSTSERVTAMLGMGAPPNARNFCSFSSVRLWMASSVPLFLHRILRGKIDNVRCFCYTILRRNIRAVPLRQLSPLCQKLLDVFSVSSE